MPSHRHAPVASALPNQPFFASAQDRAALARERFFDEGQRPSGLVPDAVIQSWMRCQAARRVPRERIGFDPVTPTRLHSTLQRGRPLLAAAQARLLQLEAALGGTNCRAILTDGDGVVVHSTPASGAPEPVLGVAARVGVNLSEAAVGTTAPGIVVRTGQACTVSAGEHFFDACRTLRCAAAPIRDRRGQLAGVLDLTVEQCEFDFDAAALVGLYAAAIENGLLRLPSGDCLLLRFQASPLLLGTPMEALAGIDTHGQVAWVNGVAQRLLGAHAPLGRPVEEVFGLGLPQLLQWTRPAVGTRRPQRLASGLNVWLQAQLQSGAAALVHSIPASVPADPPSPAANTPSTLAEHDRQHVLDTLARCGGNVSRAARELGVSRGLLYRRLAGLQASG
jgi:transcriptional regulator of acetoin/glycerol metabolism